MKKNSLTSLARALIQTALLVTMTSSVSCGAQPVAYYCLEVLVQSQNHSNIDNARLTVLPPSPYDGMLSISTSGGADLPFCSGTHSFQITHPNYRTKRVTYTSPRDRPVAGNMWEDQITVIMDSL
jgi:hypothetical protein